MGETLFIGLDAGATALKTVVVDGGRQIIETNCVRTLGSPLETARRELTRIQEARGAGRAAVLAVTGSVGRRLSALLERPFVNEIVAQAAAASSLMPEVRTIIEIGGASSKLISVTPEDGGGLRVDDFAMNAICAAGTGSFLDQQASRLGLSIGEFGRLALASKNPPRLAGRCSVFAKSDMIHLQQQAATDYDIVAGLCFALARSVKGGLARGRDLTPPVAFVGGAASNPGLVRALREVLALGERDFIVPEHHVQWGALGAILEVMARGAGARPLELAPVAEALRKEGPVGHVMAPLTDSAQWTPRGVRRNVSNAVAADAGAGRIYLGVDVGSISTNVVALDESGSLVAKSYLMTAGRPLEAVRQGLKEVRADLPQAVEVLGAATTGSGRYLTGDFIGADVVRNEITAQARGAVAIDPTVDTIFEIGGQDSKFIRLEGAVVVDFEMNHACAAGTGSFLEEQAERLGISIKEEFARIALGAKEPLRLGERCTVFMETDLLCYQHQGAAAEQLVAGLAYSIVTNYLNRVVGHRKIGSRIFFQGGTASNAAVVAAFEKCTGRPVFVPEHHEVTGAIGAALLAREHMSARGDALSGFRGFDLAERPYSLESFECADCPNHCEVKKVRLQGEDPLYYGSRCDKYNVADAGAPEVGSPDLFAERERLLDARYTEAPCSPVRGSIGIPRALVLHELLPFWRSLFEALGWKVVVSKPTTKATVRKGVERVAAATCFPVKVAHGHVEELLATDVDRVFLPSIIEMARDVPDQEMNYVCPYVQTLPYMVRSAAPGAGAERRLFSPVVHFDERLQGDVVGLARQLGATPKEAARALAVARDADRRFRLSLREAGRRFLEQLGPEGRAVVLVSRPYNGCDRGVNLDLAGKLARMGLAAIPMDMLPLSDRPLGEDWDNMFWKYGQRILAAARLIRADARLYPIYVSNFSCGPDSFLTTFFKRIMGEKPSLILEIDEHSADAGVVTRLEAFFDSLDAWRPESVKSERIFPAINVNGADRTLYIPYMSEHAHAFAAAFRACGMPAEVLPPSDAQSLALGRRYTSGRECLPAIVTAGDMVRKILEKDFDPGRSAFFMPSGTGPCRFGQYNKLHRLILGELGRAEIPVVSPNQGKSFYDDFRSLRRDPTRLAWQGLAATDILYKALHAVRPYEKSAGETDRVFRRCIGQLSGAIERGDSLPATMARLAARFRAVATAPLGAKPLVGVVGEIYVRSHPFSNQRVVEDLERLGVEVELALFAEWLYYTNFTRLRRNRRERDAFAVLKNFLKDRAQHRDERLLARAFRGILRQPAEPPTKDLVKLGNRYLHDSFEGEAILTVGKTLELCGHGAAGVVNVMPFTCMPGTITSAILARLSEDHGRFPVLSISYDGQRESNYLSRLEAFVHQARARDDARRAAAV